MLMKYMYSILTVVLLSSIFLSSCSQNETLIDVEHSPLQFELNVKGGSPVTRTRASTGGDTVFVFVYNAADDTTPVIRLKDKLEGKNTILYYTPADDFVRASSYNIYTVATSSVMLQETLNLPISQTALCDLIQDKAGLDSDGYIISGGLRGATFNNPSKAITLLRNVCKLELSVTDQTTGKYNKVVASFDAPDQTYIFSSYARGKEDIPSGAVDISNLLELNKQAGNLYSEECYFFEKSDSMTLNIQASGVGEAGKDTTFNYKVVLANTERNTIYQVNAGLNLTGLTVTTSVDLNWKGNIEEDQELTPVHH